jgi:3'-phosphoadenosine 5'-phosphosulfate sulfotransferase (PAPS reductase)/FAD synthetase
MNDAMVKNALTIIDEAIEKYNPCAILGLFSGGHDSLTATSIASKHPRFTAAVHINTGIGIEQTREFVRETCKREGWPLREYFAQACGQDYREMVLKDGFPGPYGHRFMYIRLKERPLRECIREFKKERHSRILLVSGARSQESIRRMAHVEPIYEEGVRIWTSIIHDWSKIDCNDYIAMAGLKRNEVVDMIHKSGECLCGAYAKPGELAELAYWFPNTAKAIYQLEEEVKAHGHDWGWEGRPPRKGKYHGQPDIPGMLCVGCERREAK